jgi:hypothetical protein
MISFKSNRSQKSGVLLIDQTTDDSLLGLLAIYIYKLNERYTYIHVKLYL